MSKTNTRTRCAALTRSGEPCKNYALNGSGYCRFHQPSGAGQAAGKRARANAKADLGPGLRQQLTDELDSLARRAQIMARGKPSNIFARKPPDTRPADTDTRREPPAPKQRQDDLWGLPEEKSIGPSLVDVAMLGVGAFFLFRWLFRRRPDK